ncbi:N-acetylmuramoyl-L-alanine amidase [Clostridium sp. D53t1_180928_C8]|uniref:N-acetylmuramoyl-L-alanine amidase family protein n=1 Tax=Clostridium sp. D53t1_180928_C8 TaxID=2787101 RepID=UPI0018A8FFCD|nr:N-acetylmuramoyl-L-alanine amidase [Clostridium sp. D53t1_180928_C8]
MAKWLLDPGHGGTDSGATYKGRRECDDVLRLALRVGEILKSNGENVYYTRVTDDTLSLADRSSKENVENYDYFVSIHRNAYRAESAKGVETHVYATGETAEQLASKVNEEMVKNGFVNRGVKVSNFHVLRETKCPAILVEVGFIDNTSENSLFDLKFEKIAQSISKGCLLQIGKEISIINSSNSYEVYYRCVVGSFKERINAENRKAELIAKGYKDTFIEIYKKN